MSKKYTTNFLEDTNGSTGSANQVLVSTAAGIDWVDGSGSGIIGGPYLPLAGGTLTGNTNLTGSTKKLILKSGAQLGFEDAAPTGTIYLYNDGAATSRLNIGGTMWVEEAGNVGIGTASMLNTGTSRGSLTIGGAAAGTINIGNGSINFGIYATTSESSIYSLEAMKFSVGSGFPERMRITSSGNVGIGTTSPSRKLDVQGGYFVTSDGGSNQVAFVQGGNGYAYFGNLGNGKAAFGNSENYTTLVADGGNVGIGTTNPGQKLAVQSSFANTASDSFVEINSGHEASGGSDITGEAGVLFKQAGSGNVLRSAGSIVSGREGNYSATSVADSYLAFSTAQNSVNAEKMRITSSGNVGIGTTSPVSHAPTRKTLVVADTVNGANVEIWGNQTGGKSILQSVGGNTYVGNLANGTGSGTTYITSGAGSTYTTILANGNVGIGTTSPDAKLQVAGGFRLGDGAYTSIDFNADPSSHQGNGGLEIKPSTVPGSGTANWYTRFASNVATGTTNHNVTIDGNVGIGTTAPSSKLHIDSTGEALRFTRTGQEEYRIIHGTSGLYFTMPNSSALALGITQNSDVDIFNTSGGVMFRADGSTGNVGIGTTSPGYKLTVTGDAGFSDWIYASKFYPTSSTTDILMQTGAGRTITLDPTSTGKVLMPNGNVGIGTTTPGAKLDVLVGGTNHIQLGASALGSTGDYIGGLYYSSNKLLMESFLVGTGYQDILLSPNGGNVGIGTDSPEAKLNILSTGIDDEALVVQDNARKIKIGRDSIKVTDLSNAVANMYLQGDGSNVILPNAASRLGIGTTNPSASLEVKGDGDIIRATRGTFTVTTSMTSGSHNILSYGKGFNVGTSDANSLGFSTSNSTRLLINSAGNVGIGTTTPSEKLEVSGNVKAETLIATDLNDGYVPYSKSGTLGLQDSKIYTNGVGIGVGTTTLAAGCHITSLSNISATGYRVSAMQTAPSSRGDTGTLGEIRITADYIYVCYATNSWKRVAIAQW